MATAVDLFGADLRLLGDLEHQSDRNPGDDLFIVKRAVTASAQTDPIDLETISGRDNLQQALLLRFVTRRGELAILGHPDYGSRLHELIGELNDQTRRNRAKLYALEALAGEPRVASVLSVTATQNPADRTEVDLAINLVAINDPTPLNFVFAVYTGAAVS